MKKCVSEIILFPTLVLIAASTFVGCQKLEANKFVPPAASPRSTAETLEGKSPYETVKAKYTKANVVCRLWTQIGPKLNTAMMANDEVVLDLLDPSLFATGPQEILLRGQTLRDVFDVNLSVSHFDIRHVTHVDTAGTVYKLRYSPTVEVAQEHQTTSKNRRRVSAGGSGSPQSLVEGERRVLVSTERQFSDENESTFHHLECTIETKIRPEYADQFDVTPSMPK